MEATWRQPTRLTGLSRFLVEHEPCGAGFDVSHPAGLGSGRVSMTCRGCGATYEYATATIEFEREVEFEPVMVEAAPSAPPAPSSPPASSPPPRSAIAAALPASTVPGALAQKPGQLERPLSSRGAATPPRSGKPKRKGLTRERAGIVALLILSVAAMAVAVTRFIGDRSESSSSTSPPPSSAPVVPAHTQPSHPAPATPKPQAAKPKPAEKPKQNAKTAEPAPSPSAGEKVVKTSQFSTIVPDSWEQKEADGGFLLSPSGNAPVSVQVFYENDSGMSRQDMATQTEGFLRSRDPSAKVTGPKDLSVAGDPSFELHASGPAGSQVARGILSGSYRYLVIESADPGTPKSMRAQADRALTSFRPR